MKSLFWMFFYIFFFLLAGLLTMLILDSVDLATHELYIEEDNCEKTR